MNILALIWPVHTPYTYLKWCSWLYSQTLTIVLFKADVGMFYCAAARVGMSFWRLNYSQS